MSSTGKPFLRSLKCAYKLHQAGLSEVSTINFLAVARRVPDDKLPSAGAPVDVIIATVHEFSEADLVEQFVGGWADELGFEVQ